MFLTEIYRHLREQGNENGIYLFLVPLWILCVVLLFFSGCLNRKEPESRSGAKIADVEVPVDPEGLTVEQQNVRERLLRDNMPGSIKHLYVFSAYTGTPLIYSTVMGKVTSSGKRLTPTQIKGTKSMRSGFYVEFPDFTGVTGEVIQDDGTYGTSVPYLFWFDAKGVYH